jgi:Zn-finger protein
MIHGATELTTDGGSICFKNPVASPDFRNNQASGGRFMNNSDKFFRNTGCKYFPCHDLCPPERFNCLFCYCPLYFLGDQCGGAFEYTGNAKQIKNCTHCTFPHDPDNYDRIIAKLKEMCDYALTRKQP